MAKPELGEKHTCVSCGARFFDLGKQPAVCPKCSTEQPAEQPRLKRMAPLPEEQKKIAKPASDADDLDVEVPDADDDEDILDDNDDDIDDGSDVIDADIEVPTEGNDDER